MKKKIFTLFAMMCCVVGLQAETVTKTWDFSEYEERVDLGGTTYTLTYNELTLVGLSGADAGKEYVSAAKSTVATFIRLEVGEGIEKVEADFAAEVAAQVAAAK